MGRADHWFDLYGFTSAEITIGVITASLPVISSLFTRGYRHFSARHTPSSQRRSPRLVGGRNQGGGNHHHGENGTGMKVFHKRKVDSLGLSVDEGSSDRSGPTFAHVEDVRARDGDEEKGEEFVALPEAAQTRRATLEGVR